MRGGNAVLVMPQSGSEPRFGPEPFRTGPKSGSRFGNGAEPDRKSGSRFGGPPEVVNRVRTELDLNLRVEGRVVSAHSHLNSNIAAPPQTSQPLKCRCSNVAAPAPLKHTLKFCPSNGTAPSNVSNLLPLPILSVSLLGAHPRTVRVLHAACLSSFTPIK